MKGMDSMKRHIIGSGESVRSALSAINSLSGEAMTLFVVDDSERLLGTVTDGDIRRSLLGGATLESPVNTAMHRDCLKAGPKEGRHLTIAEARRRGIDLLPVVEGGRIIEILDLRRIRTSLPLEAVLMAGGRGERLRPLTLDKPKPLLPVGGKAIIDYNIEELRRCGIERIYVTVNYLREQLEEHFREAEDVSCVAEPKRLGTLGSLSLIDGLKTDNILVMNSDLLTDLDFEKMYLHHIESGADMTVATIPYNVAVPFAIMDLEGDRVKGLREKPNFNYFANAGVYILRKSLTGGLERGEYLDAPDFMEDLIAKGGKVVHFPIDGTWIDIGSPADYRYADELMRRNRS